MYFLDFAKSLANVKRIGVIIWIVLNAVVVTFVVGLVLVSADLGLDDWLCLLIGFGIYILSLVIALSPIGEAILRGRQKCRAISDPNLVNRLNPIFNRVLSRAVQLTPNLNRNIRLYICEDESPNAFATGRNTICITKGLLNLSDEEIESVLAHEFGHLAHKDTDIILIVAVGNMIVNIFFFILNIIISIFSFFTTLFVAMFSNSGCATFLSTIPGIIARLTLSAFMRVWTMIGVLLCMISNRGDEYDADEYAFNLGYGRTLSSVLSKIGGDAQGFWAALNSAHPKTSKRIERLNQLSGSSAGYNQY